MYPMTHIHTVRLTPGGAVTSDGYTLDWLYSSWLYVQFSMLSYCVAFGLVNLVELVTLLLEMKLREYN
jgi:hypothetical protein